MAFVQLATIFASALVQPAPLPRRAVLAGAGAAAASQLLVRPAIAADELSYTVVTPPTDPSSPTPQRAQRVVVDYTLWLDAFNGKKQIDTSKGSAIPPKLPSPFSFMVGVGEVIPGWDRTLRQMRVGETRQVVVPASLGYGEKGIGPIPGGAPLYFEVTLLELKPMKDISEKQQQWLATHPEP
tara:strand:- start:551 stop:1099 length:549 start_codon:yes stop_codon:yes gene_type:complete